MGVVFSNGSFGFWICRVVVREIRVERVGEWDRCIDLGINYFVNCKKEGGCL